MLFGKNYPNKRNIPPSRHLDLKEVELKNLSKDDDLKFK